MQENSISSLCRLDATASLTCLDLSFNALTLDCVPALAPLVALQQLRMNDNPACADKHGACAAGCGKLLPEAYRRTYKDTKEHDRTHQGEGKRSGKGRAGEGKGKCRVLTQYTCFDAALHTVHCRL